MWKADFAAADRDRSGVISLAELVAAWGPFLSRAEVMRAFAQVDADKDKVLSFEEFLRLGELFH